MFSNLINWWKAHFSKNQPAKELTQLPPTPKTVTPVSKPIESDAKSIHTPGDDVVVAKAEAAKSTIPTRAEIYTFVKGLMDVQSPYGLPYNQWRETKGKNRSPEIDKMIVSNGGNLGDSYCLFGNQDICRAIEKKFNCKIDLPHGGGTQNFWEKVKDKYKRNAPGMMCIGIYRHGTTWQGHAVHVLGGFIHDTWFATFEFNTDAKDQSKIVRDGQGCGYLTRSTEKMPGSDMVLRGFVDIYDAIIWPSDKVA